MFSAKFNLIKPFSRLIKKQKLETLDIVYNGQPFCNVVSKNQNTYNLDTTYLGQPFIGTPNNYIRRLSAVGTNHPDVQNWLNIVTLNNGGASSTTIAALNTFCHSIDSAGLRNKFYRLSLFCGNNLNSCLVPLYVSTGYSNIPYGADTDTNFNFIEADYNETGSSAGLTSSGADPTQINSGSKYLNCTIRPSDIIPVGQSVNNMHLAATASCTALSAAGQFIFYNTFAYVDIYSLSVQLLGGFANIRGMIGSQIVNSQIVPLSTGLVSPAQHIMTSRISNSDARNYQSGTQSGSTNTTPISTTNSSTQPFLLFRQSAGYYSNLRLTDYSIGVGLTSSESLAYYNILQTFKATLSRS